MYLYYIIQSYLVYILLAIILIYGAKETHRTKCYAYLMYVIIIYGIVFGLRYGVGTDCIQYIKIYKNAQAGIYSDKIESGYNILMELFTTMELPSWCFMGFIALAQLSLIIYAFKDKSDVIPYIIFTFMLGCTWLTYANGMRQTLAFCIFLVAIYYAQKQRIIIYLGLIVLALLIHKSAVILLFLYPRIRMNGTRILPIKYQYILFIIAFILGRIAIIQNLMSYVEIGAEYLGYDAYFDNFREEKWFKELNYGIGYYINILLILIIFRYSYLFVKSKIVSTFYNFFFIGVLLKYAFLSSSVIQRVNYYFYGFDYIVGAIILYLLHKYRKMSAIYILTSIYILIFIGVLSKMYDNDSAFYFIWQANDYSKMHLHIIK